MFLSIYYVQPLCLACMRLILPSLPFWGACAVTQMGRLGSERQSHPERKGPCGRCSLEPLPFSIRLYLPGVPAGTNSHSGAWSPGCRPPPVSPEAASHTPLPCRLWPPAMPSYRFTCSCPAQAVPSGRKCPGRQCVLHDSVTSDRSPTQSGLREEETEMSSAQHAFVCPPEWEDGQIDQSSRYNDLK